MRSFRLEASAPLNGPYLPNPSQNCTKSGTEMQILELALTSQCIRKIGKDLERMRTNENKVERSMRTPF